MRAEINPQTIITKKHEQLVSPGINEYGKLVKILEDAGGRMAKQTNHKTLKSLLYDSIGVSMEDYYYGPNVFLTDKADVLPYPKTVYHVSGGKALENLQRGEKLIPTDAHFLGNVSTDKGIAG